MIVLYTIYCIRGILKAIGIKWYLYSPYEYIEALHTALSKEKYIELYCLLIGIVFIIYL
jgi:hypothetical protein